LRAALRELGVPSGWFFAVGWLKTRLDFQPERVRIDSAFL